MFPFTIIILKGSQPLIMTYHSSYSIIMAFRISSAIPWWWLSTILKQCTIVRENPWNYHTFALFDPPKMGNLMTPDVSMAKKTLNSKTLESTLSESPASSQGTATVLMTPSYPVILRILGFWTAPWGQYSTSWWLNQPIWKICASQIGSFPAQMKKRK